MLLNIEKHNKTLESDNRQKVTIILSKFVLNDLRKEAQSVQDVDTQKIIERHYPTLHQLLKELVILE